MEKGKTLNNNKQTSVGNIVGDLIGLRNSKKNAGRMQMQEQIPKENAISKLKNQTKKRWYFYV